MDAASLAFSLIAQETPTLAQRTGQVTTQLAYGKVKLSPGSGLSEVQQAFADDQTIAASGSKTYDLHAFGGAVDALGAAYALTRIVALAIVNTSTDPTAIIALANGSTNGFAAATGSGTGGIAEIAPGGCYLLTAPSAAALAVSSTTGAIKLTNASSTASATFQLFVLGS